MKKILGIFLLFVFISSCGNKTPQKSEGIKIAVSKEKNPKYSDNYHHYLLRYNPSVQWVDLYGLPVDSALKVAKSCQGVLLTGGNDVFPGNYGKIDDTARCGTFDLYRDTLEFALIQQAIHNKQPLIGICRGEQIINIALGGTLYIDIPTDYSTLVVHRQADWRHCWHPVYLHKNSLLYSISYDLSDTVTSNHHQGIERVGNGLRVVARAADSLAEAIEWADTIGKGFLMAVQWHPERMPVNHPLSKSIACKFLEEAKIYQTKQP